MSGASGTATAERDTAGTRRGARFSDKQIAHAVKDRKAITIVLPNGQDLITGFVYGMDDFHIGIVDEYSNTSLVHKSAAAAIRFTDNVMSSGGQPGSIAEKIREICEPFRNRVMREHFSQTSAAQ